MAFSLAYVADLLAKMAESKVIKTGTLACGAYPKIKMAYSFPQVADSA